MERKPFSEINKIFFSEYFDPDLFNAGRFNSLKIIQHAIVYEEYKVFKKIVKNPFVFYPLPFFWMIVLLKKISGLFNPLPKYQQKKNLFIEPGRLVPSANPDQVSLNFERIYQEFDEKDCFIIKANSLPYKKADTDFIETIRKFKHKINSKDIRLAFELRKHFNKLSKSKKFSKLQLKFIKSHLFKFWEEYRWFGKLIDQVNPEICMMVCHYHKEGMILALKESNVAVIEFQHGLISTNDLYYVYPKEINPIASKALFPDKILVWGEYWKEKLLRGGEFTEAQIKIIGDFRAMQESMPLDNTEKEKLVELTKGKKIILVTSQKTLEKYYVEYLKVLLSIIEKKHNDWIVVVKFHPSEKKENFYLSELDSYNSKILFFIKSEFSLNILFMYSNIHISFYSTTLYDALRYDIKNLSIQDFTPFKGYAKELRDDNIATGMEINDDPVEFIEMEKDAKLSMDEVFGPYNSSFLKIIKNQ
jgi:hypothetical protein